MGTDDGVFLFVPAGCSLMIMGNPASAEPGKLLASGEYEGYRWEITLAGLGGAGHRCGYVRLPLGHPWHGLDADDIHAAVHGGVTYSRSDTDPGLDGGDWWIGFHCAYAWDAPDPELPTYEEWQGEIRRLTLAAGGTVKDNRYVEGQCKRLIRQAVEATHGRRPRGRRQELV